MKELEEDTIEQIRTLLNYLEQTDLFEQLNERIDMKRKGRKEIKCFKINL